jgi:hypothetical protein
MLMRPDPHRHFIRGGYRAHLNLAAAPYLMALQPEPPQIGAKDGKDGTNTLSLRYSD